MRWDVIGFAAYFGFILWLAFSKSKAAGQVRDMINGDAWKD